MYDRKCICNANYLYKNIREENNKLVHEECNTDELIDNEILLQKAKNLIEKNISDNPNYLEEGVV